MASGTKLQIKNLLFDDLDGLFTRSIREALQPIMSEQKISKSDVAKKITPKLQELRSAFENQAAEFYLKHNKFELQNFLNSHVQNQKTIVVQNETSITSFLIYVNACVNIYEKVIAFIEHKRIGTNLKVIIPLYGLIVRRAQQIADSLVGGYIDSAMTIWRSMYENSVTLLVLALEDDSELSRRFIEHSVRQSTRKLSSYNDQHQNLGFGPLPDTIQSQLKRKRDRLVKKYGKNFVDNDYGWAEHLVQGRVTFRALEEKAGMARFRPYYILCSEQIHTGFNGFGNYFEDGKLILPRLLNQNVELKSFIDPMQFTISVLHEVNDFFIWQFSTPSDRSANMLLLRKAFEKLQESFDLLQVESD